MKIVLDLQAAQTGVPSAVSDCLEFAKAVAARAVRDDIWILLNGAFPEAVEPIRAAFDGLIPQNRIRLFDIPTPVAANDQKNIWRLRSAEYIREMALAEIAPDIIHSSSIFHGWTDDVVTSVGAFERAAPVAVTLDNAAVLNQGLSKDKTYSQFYYRHFQSLKNSDLLFTRSEFLRQNVIRALHLPAHKVVSLSAGVCPQFRPMHYTAAARTELLDRFGISRAFFMHVTNGHDHRQNLKSLLNGFSMLPPAVRDSHQLVIVTGATARKRQTIIAHSKDFGIADATVLIGPISNIDLIALFNHCAGAIFPAFDEPSGTQVLEAMACGAPVIGANTAAIAEVIGNKDAVFDPTYPVAIAASIARLAGEQNFRDLLSAVGTARAKAFSWDACATKALDAFNEISDLERLAKITTATAPVPRVKPRLAFVSPLPPSRSGVSDYSAELLPALALYYDIDVIPCESSVSSPSIDANFTVRSAAWFEIHGGSYDRILYQFGNSPFHDAMIELLQRHAGTVVLHDFFLSDLISSHEALTGEPKLFRHALYESHGYPALMDERIFGRIAAIEKYPVSLQIIEAAGGVIVHSHYARTQARRWYNSRIEDFSVIPQLHALPPMPVANAREQLGLQRDEFIVIACGFIDPNKIGERLLAAWLASPLAEDARCHLIFVGEYNKGPFGETMRRLVNKLSVASKITVTGYVTAEQYAAYQNAADAAVQLRTRSRGETSRAVLDCLANGLPTIINANGAMAEIPGDAALIIPDAFTDRDLINALMLCKSDGVKRAELAQNARAYVAQECDPAHVAALYRQAVESFFHTHQKFRENRLLDRLACLKEIPGPDEISFIASSIDRSRINLKRPPFLFYDVSAIIRDDLKTGIQRVTRNILCELLENRHPEYRVEPVYDDGHVFRYARDFTLRAIDISDLGLEDDVADIASGDIFVAVDFDALGIVRNAAKLRAWRAAGVKICVVIYDMLPITHPEFFPPGAELPHAAWLSTAVEHADWLACISQTVAGEVRRWTDEHSAIRHRTLEISWFHLGADIRPSNPQPIPANLAGAFGSWPTLLMVGTIEPRKGHLQALAAVELLWERNVSVNLIIVGGEGWVHLPDRQRRTIPAIVRRLRDHPELNKRIFWAEALSDGELESVYRTSTCLLAASEGEGFGLPPIEAAQYGLPVIARDIPVFREVAGDFAFYFDGLAPENLAAAITRWLELQRTGEAPDSAAMPWISWAESALQLQEIIAGR